MLRVWNLGGLASEIEVVGGNGLVAEGQGVPGGRVDPEIQALLQSFERRPQDAGERLTPMSKGSARHFFGMASVSLNSRVGTTDFQI